MSTYRTLNEVTEDYLRKHPDKVDDYITVLFDEYAVQQRCYLPCGLSVASKGSV